MATFRVSRTQTIIAQFRDFDQRFLAIGQLHGSSSLASSKRHRNKVATMLRARPRATGMPVAVTRLSRSLQAAHWRRLGNLAPPSFRLRGGRFKMLLAWRPDDVSRAWVSILRPRKRR
jgi:hypothetical protein